MKELKGKNIDLLFKTTTILKNQLLLNKTKGKVIIEFSREKNHHYKKALSNHLTSLIKSYIENSIQAFSSTRIFYSKPTI